MAAGKNVDEFLLPYNEHVIAAALKLRTIILSNLPDVQEQVDAPAKMIAYCYGQKYAEMVCTIIPSKKGLKLGFYKGVDLPDPGNLLRGNGKISRYVEMKNEADIDLNAITTFLKEAFAAYKVRNNKN